ncbi:MAG: hypothetical protein JO008_09765, partial [Alphaproteobacteria bacterium]|nr:hypothetical protein [Alphaproteobacteria bacterium]
DNKDNSFHAAIFGNDDRAISDMTPDELRQVRRYIIEGRGEMPVRKWRETRRDPQDRVGASAMARFPATN